MEIKDLIIKAKEKINERYLEIDEHLGERARVKLSLPNISDQPLDLSALFLTVVSLTIKDNKVLETKRRQDVDQLLDVLKNTIGISAFVDSSLERMFARHIINLIQKIGLEEFKYRLRSILDDEFLAKNCNKIKFLYNNIKGFRKPSYTFSATSQSPVY